MLEKYIAALLVPYLSQYVENINEDQLKINIWSGKAALHDLVLRPEALDALLNSAAAGKAGSDDAGSPTSPKPKPKTPPRLPIKTYRGICKNVSLSIPIKRLRSEPVVVEVGEVLLTLTGADPANFDNADGTAAADATGAVCNVKAEKLAAAAAGKAKELDAYEAERKRQREEAEQQQQAGHSTATAAADGNDAAAAAQKGGSGGGGFFSRLGELVINNVIVKVDTVHIRYEDAATETVLGAVLGGVQLLTMNEATGQAMFTDPSGLQRMWKRLVFNDLQVYCDDPTRVRANAALGRTWLSQIYDWQQWYHRMRQRVRDGNVAMSTLLGPVSGSVDAKVVFKLFVRQLLDTPFADVAVKLQYVMANLTRAQYTKLLQTVMRFTNQAEVSQLQRGRPRVPVMGNAQAWWRYTIRAVRTVLAEPKRERLLARVSEACKPGYQVLYRDVVRQTPMSPEKAAAYKFATRFMTTEDMKAARKSVYAQIAGEIQLKRKDNEIRKAEEMAKQQQASAQQQQQPEKQAKRGWLSWLTGSSSASSGGADAAQSDTTREIEADEKLFQSIELEYGISSADVEADRGAAAELGGGIGGGDESGGSSSLPPSYCWLRASFDLPLTSYRIDTERGESITLKLFQLRGGVASYNKPNSLLFFFRTQNLTLANPVFSPGSSLSASTSAGVRPSSSLPLPAAGGCANLVPYLIEGVQVDRRASKSSPTGVKVSVRSLTDVDSGKQPSPEAPTIQDVMDVDGNDAHGDATPAAPAGARESSSSDEGRPLTPPDYATPLFSVTGFLHPVEQPLPDTNVDAAIKVQLLPLRIIADPRTIEQLVRFFTPPVGVDVSGFAESTRQAASAVGSAATQEVRAAMSKAKGLYVTVDASAPLLILPKSLTASASEPALCLSLGRVRFQARPLSEAEKKRRLTAAAAITSGGRPTSAAAAAAAAASGADSSALAATTSSAAKDEALFYYPHKASFSKFYLELTTVEGAMRRPQRGFLVVPEVSIAADVLQRIDDNNTAREAVVLRLKVPSLRLACSVHQTYLVTSMVDAWLARLGTSSSSPSGAAAAAPLPPAPLRPNSEWLRGGSVTPELTNNGDGGNSSGGAGRGEPPGSLVPALPSSSSPANPTAAAAGRSATSPRASPSPTAARAAALPSPSAQQLQQQQAAAGPDLPVMRLELLVQQLGLDVHDDDPTTLAVVPLPAFRLECANAETIFAVRSRHKKMVLWLKEPHIVAARDTAFPIFSGGGVRTDLLITDGDAPTAVALTIDAALNVCIGTPCVELLETVMDMVNLILSAMDSGGKTARNGGGGAGDAKDVAAAAAAAAAKSGDPELAYLVPTIPSAGGGGGGGGVTPRSRSVASRLSDLAYQLSIVRQQCTAPNRHVADVFVRVPGPVTVTLLNRPPGADRDKPFASASLRGAEVKLSKFAVTMDVSGRVGEVSAAVLESSGLAPANLTLLAYRPPSQAPSSASSSGTGSGRAGAGRLANSAASRTRSSRSSSTASGTEADGASSGATPTAHISFSFRKYRPVMPLFAEVDGQRTLANPKELRYSSALELDVGASTITLDLHTVMVFKTYFTSGLFSRVSRLADRSLYNGRTLPPTREGPRLLMGMRIVVRDTLVVLPVDPRAAASHRFCASLGRLTVQNSLRPDEGQEVLSVSLGDVGMWCAGAGGSPAKGGAAAAGGTARSALLPTPTCAELSVQTPLDLQWAEAPHVDVRSDDVSVELREADLVQLVGLLRQNLTRTDPAAIAAYTLEASQVRQVVLHTDGKPVTAAASAGTTASTHPCASGGDDEARAGGELTVSLRLGRISMLLTDQGCETASNPVSPAMSRFRLHSTCVAMSLAMPANSVGVRWKSLELNDVRGDTSSALVWCESGSLHLADSVTTHSILMSDFGVRRAVGRSGGSEVAGDGGGRPDSKETSTASGILDLSPAAAAAAAREQTRRRAASRRGSEGGGATAPDAAQQVTVSVLSADFTLRRFAVSDQWLALYDLVCNEAVLSAWTAPQTGMTDPCKTAATPTPTSPAPGDGGAGKSGMRVVVTTPSVVIPFLNSRRETLIEASIGAVLADVVVLPTVRQVAVKVRELSVVDTRSGEKIIFKRAAAGPGKTSAITTTNTGTNTTATRTAPTAAAPAAAAAAPATHSDWEDGWDDVDPPFSPLVGGAAAAAAEAGVASTGAGAGSGAASTALAVEEAEVLQLAFKSDPVANTNKIQLGVGELNALVAMPVIQGLVDYFTSPAEPVAKIASLGVMREQRARMAAAALQMANSSLLIVHVLWRQPRIVLAGDAMQLQRRSGNLEMRLGVMRAAVRMQSSAAALSVVVKAQEYSIPSLLKRSSLRFAYDANRGVETVELWMERTTALFHAAEVERLVRLAQRNLLMPRDTNYYGEYERPATAQSLRSPKSSLPSPASAASPGSAPQSAALKGLPDMPSIRAAASAAEPQPPQQPTPPSRTVKVHLNGLLVAVHDAVGANTHTLTLTALETTVAPDGSVALSIPSLCMMDQSTGKCMVQSEAATTRASAASSPNTAAAPALPAPTAAAPEGSDSSSSSSSSADSALHFTFDPERRTADVQLSALLVTVIPRSIGTLVNTLLSVRVPGPDDLDTDASSLSASVTSSTGTAGLLRTTTVRSSGAPVPATAVVVPATAAASALPFVFTASLPECRVRFCQGDREVALLRLARIACRSTAFSDGASELSVALGNLFMVDSATVNTNYRTFIYPYEDVEAGERAGTDATASAAIAAAVPSQLPTPASPLNALVTYELRTSAPPPPPPRAARRKKKCSSFAAAAAAEAPSATTPPPQYTRHMKCRMGSLSFVIVPDVVRTVMAVLGEVQTHVSEGNREKAYNYVSDRAAESVRRRKAAEQLMEIDVVVSRPQVLLVDKPTATMGVQLSPGCLSVKSELVQPSGAAATTSASSSPATVAEPESRLATVPREVFTVQVRKMSMMLQGDNCFQQDCNIHVQLQRALPPSAEPSAAPAASTTAKKSGTTSASAKSASGLDGVQAQLLLKVKVPVLAMTFTREQTDFAMNVLGALMNGTDTSHTVATVAPAKVTTVKSTAAPGGPAAATGGGAVGTGQQRRGAGLTIPLPDSTSRRPSSSSDAGGGSGTPSATAPSPAAPPPTAGPTTGARAGGNSNGSERGGLGSTLRADSHVYVPPPRDAVATAFTLHAEVGLLQAELADLFRLRVEETRVLSTDVNTTGKTTDIRIAALFVQHVGAEVEVAAPPGSSTGEPGAAASPSGKTGRLRPTSRIQELVDLLTITKLRIVSLQPLPVIDSDAGSSMTENSVNIGAEVFNVAVSPTILFDTRELLYLPFCYKVLRIPIDPVPILSLMEETTVLQEDVVLDNKHVLLTASRTRCCYVLDLNGYTLSVADAPSGQIVLCEGCELTLTNGTVHIPGMYTIGSYVSFAPSTALFTTNSVRVEKDFLGVSNEAFYSTMLARPLGGRSAGGSPRSLGETSRHSSSAAVSPSSSIDPLAATTGPPPASPRALLPPNAVELRDRTVRLLVSFACDAMSVQMLSEEVVDLSVSLCTQSRVRFVQDTENEQAARRTVSVQLLHLHSGENEEHVLLPTDVVMNVSGVENVSVSLVVDSIEFCTRATLLRSLVELGKDFGAAFIEETTLARVKPRVEYETASLDPLVPVLEAGECEHCGRQDAYLAPAANKPGILCYKCCTAHDHVPAIDFRVEVPLVDGVVFGSKGDMAHLFMRNVLLSVDPSMDLQLTLRTSLHGFSNSAAVWEPFLEQVDVTVTGSVNTHDYKVRMDRLDYVVSPQNVRLLGGMAADYGDATALQKQLRKRFRRQKQLRTQQTAPNQGVPMYVDAAVLDEDARMQQTAEEEEMLMDETTSNADAVNTFRPLGATTTGDLGGTVSNANPALAGIMNTSIFDVLASTNRHLLGVAAAAAQQQQQQDQPPKRGYAHVHVKNYCNGKLLIDGRGIAARGGSLRFFAKESSVTIQRDAVAGSSAAAETGYTTSISNPALYVQMADMVVETRVVLSQEEGSRHLRRTITMTLYPLHSTNTIICFENRLGCSLASTPGNPPVRPGERFYIAPTTDLNTPLVVQPVNSPDKVEYEPGMSVGDAVTASSSASSSSRQQPARLPTLQEVLCGLPLIVTCPAKSASAKSMTVVVYVRQEEMRGGVPTFAIAVESRFRLRNKLPYRIIVNVLPDVDGSLAKGKPMSRPVPPLASTVLEVRQSTDLGLNGYSLNQVAFVLEVRQRARRGAGGGAAAATSASVSSATARQGDEEEVFSTLVPTVVTRDKPFIVLRSQRRRQLVLRAAFATNNSSIMFSTPYVLLNHSPIPLTLRECTRSGENKLYEAEPNFSVLRAEMSASVAACPLDIRKSEDFFVNLYHEEYRGTCVPLHAQQRGVVVMQNSNASAADQKKSSSSSSSSSSKKKKDGASSARTPGPTVIHLAYSTQVDPNGSLLVIFTPRWVIVNRSRLPLYAAPATYSGITAKEAAAAASAAMVAARQQQREQGGGSTESTPSGSPTQQQHDVDAMKRALQDMAAEDSIVFLSDAPTQVVAVPPQSAMPLLETPLCSPEVGYNLHILQSPLAPLYGTPVGIESIHSELIIAYKPQPDAGPTAVSGVGARGSPGGAVARRGVAERDRFLEVSLVVRDSYTYVVLEPPAFAPFLLLNRTGYAIDVRDTATKSRGRLMARVAPGCGAELFLDSTVTTLIDVELYRPDGRQQVGEVSFDVGRPMTRHEVNTAATTAPNVLYSLGYGGHGQQIIEIAPATPALPIAYTSVPAPPIPINLLLNLAVATLSVVMPNKDILFCAVTDIRFSWDRQKDREVVKFSMENFQADNQTEVSPRYDSCILSLRTTKSVAAVSGYLERVLVPAKGLICLEEVRLDVVPLALRVSDTLLVAVAGFVQALLSGNDAPAAGAQANQSLLGGSSSTVELQEAAAASYERCPSAAKLFNEAPVQIDIWASRLTLERFIVNPIAVRVWFTRDVEEHDFFRENLTSKDAALLSMMVPSCEDVTVAAPGVVTAKQSSRLGIFVQWVGKTYTDGLLAQLKGLLFQYASSLPLIGAPLKLASGFGNGAVRLFREPIEGLSTSPTAFATGIARGSAGFAQEFAGGGLGAVSNITDSWSRLLSMGGGVSERERRKQNVLTGLASGLKGVIQRPMEGAAESGAAGLLRGTAHGLVGVLANPMSGLLSDMSRATGTLAKLVTDTYIPQTKRLRPIRDFYANGGVAPWRSVASVYQYQRIQVSSRTWSGDQLISSVDGPEWYPSQREGATFGKAKTPIPPDRWILDRYHTNFLGWTFSTKYYGIYTDRITTEVRVRRMRWTALIRPLPYSRVAFYLRVCPGMETQPRRTASTIGSGALTPQESTVEFTAPGVLQATTVEQAKARKRRLFGLRSSSASSHSRSGSAGGGASGRSASKPRRSASAEFFADEEYAARAQTLHERMRSWTATGRNVGVKGAILRSHTGIIDDDEELPDGVPATAATAAAGSRGGSGGSSPTAKGSPTAALQAPDAPRDKQRTRRSHHSRSNSELDAGTSAEAGNNRQGVLPTTNATTAANSGRGSGKTEAAGWRVPAPVRYVRSASGKMVPSDAATVAAATAPVPGASATVVPRTVSSASAPPPSTIVEIYEYEKKVALLGWGKRYLPSECPGWQDAHGHEVPSRQNIRAPAGWVWATDWTVMGGDADGWTMVSKSDRNLRRRMWQRRLVKQPAPSIVPQQ